VEKTIPAKQFYSIGEVSRITGVRPHVLRYWEAEGKILRPNRKRSRHRLYRPADIQLIFEIKRLRDEEKLSLAALRRQLNSGAGSLRSLQAPAPAAFPRNEILALLKDIREDLLALKAILA
jgi:DNA-binding transcriptional MerR regulator